MNLGNAGWTFSRFVRMSDFILKVLITPESPCPGWFRPFQKLNGWNDVYRKELYSTPPMTAHIQCHSWTFGFIQLHVYKLIIATLWTLKQKTTCPPIDQGITCIWIVGSCCNKKPSTMTYRNRCIFYLTHKYIWIIEYITNLWVSIERATERKSDV